jgi:predicted nuclease of predicted toxin-antitoxin system
VKWLLDEGIPKPLAVWLRDRGHDVVAVGASEHRSQPDSVLWQVAGREGRVVITRDRGFLCPGLRPSPGGIVVVRTPDDWKGPAISLFVWDALHRLGLDSLVGTVTIIDLNRTRQRPLSEIPVR